MNKGLVKVTACCLTGALMFTEFPFTTQAMTVSHVMPVAGIARALNEGKSVTSVKADKIKFSASGNELTALSAGEAIEEIVPFESTVKKETTIKETADNTDPAILTVGAASATISVSEDEVTEIVEEPGSVSQDGAVEGDESELVNVITESENTSNEEEDFTNLVIAQVNDYVNVRDKASEEEGEVVGKLYNNSVGDLLETEGDWIKIKSGNVTGYVKGEYVVTGDDAVALAKEVGVRTAVVTTTTLYVRSEPSTEAEVLGMVPIEDELTVTEELDGWVKVSIEEGDGYVSTEFVDLVTDFVRAESKEEEEARLAKEEAARKAAQEAADKAVKKASKNKESAPAGGAAPAISASGSDTGSAVANYGLQFVGNPYVFGGSSLTNGTDCSGFVMSVSLPHSSGADRGVGYDVGGLGNAQAGDIVCYSGHVGIYIGNGQIVHASTASTGIKVSNANYRNVLAVRRIF